MIDRMVARRRSASKALLVLGDIACQVACQAVEAALAGWAAGFEPQHLRSEFAKTLTRRSNLCTLKLVLVNFIVAQRAGSSVGSLRRFQPAHL
jgi:hypothetical protein